MSEQPPPTAPGDERPGLHPFLIVLLVVVLAALVAGLSEPDLWWLIAIGIPVVAGVLASIGYARGDRVGRFFRGLWVAAAVEVIVGAITFGIVWAVCTSMAQSVTA